MSEEKTLLNRLGLYGILGLIFILPILFFPSGIVGVQFAKVSFFAFVVLLLLALFIVMRLKEKNFALFKSPLFYAAWGIPLAYLVSSLFAENVRLSLFGDSLGTDTFAFMLLGVLGLSLVLSYLRTRMDILKAYLALLGVAFLVALFHIIRLIFGPEVLSFGIFTDQTANLIGSWNDLAVFFGLVTILSMLFLTAAQGVFRYILGASIALSLFFLALVNFNAVWWIVGIFALGSFVHSIVGKGSGKAFSFASLFVLTISIVFLFGNLVFTTGSPGEFLSSAFNISQLEVRPSWQSTVDIAKATYQDGYLFGSGPSTFTNQYLLHKPEGINQTVFWNTDFRFGIGLIPTSFITTGVIGGLAWILFFGMLLYVGFRELILRGTEDAVGYHIMLSTFLSSVYLWALTILYTPSSVMVLFAFLMTGLFLVSLRKYSGGEKQWVVSFSENPRFGFVVVLLLVVAFLGSTISIFGVSQRVLAEVAFGQARIAANAGNFRDALESLNRARSFGESERFERFGVALEVQRLSELLNTPNIPQAQAQSRFQSIFGEAIASAQRAINLNNANYQNWGTLGSVYQAVVPLQITGAYENAARAYDEAMTRNPRSPALSLTRAQLEAARNNFAEAERFAQEAVTKKNNYTAAVFLLSQIQVQRGDTQAAIRSAEQAALLAPNDPVVFFQVGVLNYSANNSTNAIGALERAVALNTQYSNARYFLGLSYYRVGNTQAAINEFERIEELNLDNQDVKDILARLRAGEEPLPGFSRDDEELPEELPLEQES
ncbi:MAG: tetratricopeptide repeat protein [Candidatus Paceibacterota bacterium]